MRKLFKGFGIFLAVLLVLAAVVPLLIPIQPLTDVQPAAAFAEPDSQFLEIDGLKVHYKVYGSGEPLIVLLHGFGASTYSWREVVEPLSAYGTVLVYDRPAFGLTDRPLPGEWQGENPYSIRSQPARITALMDHLGFDQAILVGNSAGGTVSVHTALEMPERVRALVLVDAAIYNGGGSPAWIRPFLGLPQAERIGILVSRQIKEWGPQFLDSAWHDPAKISAEIRAAYEIPLRIDNWDRALWELTRAPGLETPLVDRLGELDLPVLVVSGDDDQIVPTELSVRLAGEVPGAALVVFPNCGHVPQEECPQDFLAAVIPFLESLKGE